MELPGCFKYILSNVFQRGIPPAIYDNSSCSTFFGNAWYCKIIVLFCILVFTSSHASQTTEGTPKEPLGEFDWCLLEFLWYRGKCQT